MWEMIAAVVGLLLAVYGTADLVARIVWRMVFGARTEPVTVSVAVGEDAEYRIRRFAAWIRLCPNGGFDPTVLLSEENEPLQRLCDNLGLAVCIVKDV